MFFIPCSPFLVVMQYKVILIVLFHMFFVCLFVCWTFPDFYVHSCTCNLLILDVYEFAAIPSAAWDICKGRETQKLSIWINPGIPPSFELLCCWFLGFQASLCQVTFLPSYTDLAQYLTICCQITPPPLYPLQANLFKASLCLSWISFGGCNKGSSRLPLRAVKLSSPSDCQSVKSQAPS